MKILLILSLIFIFLLISTRNILTKIDITFAKAIILSGVFVMIYQTEKKLMAIFDTQSFVYDIGFVYDNTRVYENRYIK